MSDFLALIIVVFVFVIILTPLKCSISEYEIQKINNGDTLRTIVYEWDLIDTREIVNGFYEIKSEE